MPATGGGEEEVAAKPNAKPSEKIYFVFFLVAFLDFWEIPVQLECQSGNAMVTGRDMPVRGEEEEGG